MNFMSWSEIKVPDVMLGAESKGFQTIKPPVSLRGLFGETGRTIIRLKDTVTTCSLAFAGWAPAPLHL